MQPGKLSICLIDDDRIYQFAARKTIEATGMAGSVMVFSNGLEALDYLKSHLEDVSQLPDVIFLDINMPVMNGWQFLEEYQPVSEGLKKNVIVYMVSSSIDEYDINRSKEFQAVSEYILKPVNKEKFSELLSSVTP
ncbi:response regulator [Foetidibacter luteolus]|uniref:response regulator n=1 Tax=Foetidibacter luteolus TaxID=2608880 RepID=UPI00129ABE23|nr:response regulator [Foetidibacter luteolus]